MSVILLDTCAALWLAGGAALDAEAMAMLTETAGRGQAALLSPITAWEVGLLVSRGRCVLPVPPEAWFSRLSNQPGLALCPLSPEVLIASSFLPGSGPRDPADRIMAATARTFGYRLMTRDRALLDYAAAGHIQAIAC
jgi:PIN domain nuclease of toxin-antitoxin system